MRVPEIDESQDESQVALEEATRSSRPRVAVVLAAGKSERLARVTGGGSKALVRVAGVSLVERAVRTMLQAGIERVVVVVGYHAGPVATVVNGIRGLMPGQVRILPAEGWEAGNGASLAAAEPVLEGEELFVVSTADHVFGEAALDELLRSDEPAVIVDPRPSPAVRDEGTRVRIRDGMALGFGKDLDEPAVDCGVFVLSREIFDCQRQAAEEGDASLAGAVSRFGERRSLKAVPIPAGSWWQDVDTPEDLRACQQRLRRSLTKSTDGPVSRFLNRPLSTRLSMWLAPARLSPDLLSWDAFLTGVAATVTLGLGLGVAGGVLVHLMSVLDGMDGEAARLQLRASPRGALLDGILDRAADAAIVAGLGLWALDATTVSPAVVLLVVVAAAFGSVMSMASKDRINAHALPQANERALSWILGGRDGRLLLVTIFSILGLPLAALATIAATSLVTLLLRLFAVLRLSA
jgi:choline kinase/phosphatidylglycerophosphate synthase